MSGSDGFQRNKHLLNLCYNFVKKNFYLKYKCVIIYPNDIIKRGIMLQMRTYFSQKQQTLGMLCDSDFASCKHNQFVSKIT